MAGQGVWDISFSEGGEGSGPLFNALLQAVINSLHDGQGRSTLQPPAATCHVL